MLLCTLLLLAPAAVAQEPAPRLETAAGELPIVLAAPHGGALHPEGWPIRSSGVHVRDTHTLQMARELAEAIRYRTGRRPHLVASLVHRRHLDLNRSQEESGATLGAPQLQLWQDYHAAIEQATATARTQGQQHALLIDLHGHGHEHGLIELGFALSAETLRQPDDQLDDPAWVRGPHSLGAQLDKCGFASVPSPARPAPALGQAYFNGGYTVRRHRGAGLRAIQVELPPEPRRRAAAARQPLVDALADAILATWVAAHGVPEPMWTVQQTAALALPRPGREEPVPLRELAAFAPRVVVVFGAPVLAGEGVSDEELRAAAATLAAALDQDADLLLDDPAAWEARLRSGWGVVLTEAAVTRHPQGEDWPRLRALPPTAVAEAALALGAD